MIRILLVTIVLASFSALAICDDGSFAIARELRLKGRYEEAFEAYSKARVSAEQVLGQAECLAAIGKSNESIARLQSFLEDHESSSRVHAKLAQLTFARGRHQEAERHVAEALRLDPKSPSAMFTAAELKRVSGQIREADEQYEAISTLPPDSLGAEDRQQIGQAIAQHGRWNRDTKVFDRLVNDFYPSLLEEDGTFWPAHLESGKLFLEKFNGPDATRELNAALAINPRAAEVHVELGRFALQNFELDAAITSVERALRINPNLVAAIQLTADIAFTNLQPNNAVEPLRLARDLNPWDEGTLGRILAVYLRQDGFESGQDANSRAAKLIRDVTERNAHCGRFFAAAAESFNMLRYYPTASEYYKLSLKLLPQLVMSQGQLGLVLMRLGEEADARRILEESFELDPFNVRVKNTLDVLDLLDSYAVIETDHFILRFDRGHDGLLAEYAARFLEEEVYPEIVRSLGYAPIEKTLLEIFSRANGTSGHSWFSARMVGLPFIGTVGACAGKMFALTSPTDGKPYNWARVLRHEFVHVVNLQQTNFLIPHWFTEAIAVRNEDGGYPPEWDQILAKYVADDRLFDLSNINHGFVRPGTSERWTMAYFQAYLYADFIAQIGGPKALSNMLQEYADGRTTEEALKSVVGKSIAEFEKEYREFLATRAKGIGTSEINDQRQPIEALKAALAKSPEDPSILAKLSSAFAARKNTRDARRYAEKAIVIEPNHPVANYVMARLMFSIGDDEKAWQYINTGLDARRPDSKLLALAANLKLTDKDYAGAAKYYRVGQEIFPLDFGWTRGLAKVELASGDAVGLANVLAKIANREADKIPIARKLTQLALDRRDFPAAAQWANRVLHIDVMNPIAHAELAQALAGQGKTDEAIREYETALKLSPVETTWKAQLRNLRNK